MQHYSCFAFLLSRRKLTISRHSLRTDRGMPPSPSALAPPALAFLFFLPMACDCALTKLCNRNNSQLVLCRWGYCYFMHIATWYEHHIQFIKNTELLWQYAPSYYISHFNRIKCVQYWLLPGFMYFCYYTRLTNKSELGSTLRILLSS